MDLPLLWFLLIGVLWTGYFVLEGFDFGVGMLLGTFTRSERERRMLMRSIGPVWDGNEVWLLTAGGATFAAFPEWYATMFSGFYLPLLLILLALIVRVVAIEWRAKINNATWRRRWDGLIAVGSWLPAILWGVAFANLVQGVPIAIIDGHHQVTGGIASLVTPFTLLGGGVTLVLFLTHGAVFLALRTGGEVQQRAVVLARRLAPVAVVVVGAWVGWALLSFSRNAFAQWPALIVGLGLVVMVAATRAAREGWAFAGNTMAIAGFVAFTFCAIFPYVMPSTVSVETSLTIGQAAATDSTLTVMSIVALIFVPVVLGYQGWTYWVFRQRVWAGDIGENLGLSPQPRAAAAGRGARDETS